MSSLLSANGRAWVGVTGPGRPAKRPASLRPPACLPPQVAAMSQEVRDEVGTKLLAITLKELFQWRFMQTDPNWQAVFGA